MSFCRKFVFLVVFLLVQPAFAVDYSQYNPEDISSVLSAVRAYQEENSNLKATAHSEQEFLKFLDFYSKFISVQNSKRVLETASEVESYLYQCQILNKKYNKYGLRVVMSDSLEFYFDENVAFLYASFAPYLSKDWKELLKFDRFRDNVWYFDGNIKISKRQVKQILDFYITFNKKYPDFVEADRIKEYIENFKSLLQSYPKY